MGCGVFFMFFRSYVLKIGTEAIVIFKFLKNHLTTLSKLYRYKGCKILTKFVSSKAIPRFPYFVSTRCFTFVLLFFTQLANVRFLFLPAEKYLLFSSPFPFYPPLPHLFYSNLSTPRYQNKINRDSFLSTFSKQRVPCRLPWREVKLSGISSVSTRILERRYQRNCFRDAV